MVIAILIYQQSMQPLKLNADLLSLFDSPSVSHIEKINKRIEAQNLNKQIILVGSEDIDIAIRKATELTFKLNSLPLIETAIAKFPNAPNLEDIMSDYLPYRHNFLSHEFRSVLSEKNGDKIFAYQFSLLNQIANPAVSLSIEKDPTLSMADFFSRTVISSNGLSMHKNYLVAKYQKKHYVLVYFSPRKDDLNIDTTQSLTLSIESMTKSNSVEYIYTGSIFYTSKASKTGQQEMLLYGGISILATLILIIIAYRSFVAVIATSTLIIISFLYGYLALSIFYDQLNIIALVFSVTLIGIAADYSFHALTELKYSNPHTERKSPLAKIHSSLTMSYLTTAAGYALLLLAPFTLFQQIALFTLFGLFGALITVLLCYPFLNTFVHSKAKIDSLTGINTIHHAQKSLVKFSFRSWKIIVFLFSLSVLLIAIKQTPENVREYYSPDENLKTMENRIKNILKAPWENQYFLVDGDTQQQVLENEERLVEGLLSLIDTKDLTEYSAISTWLASSKRQLENIDLIKNNFNAGNFSIMQQNLPSANWVQSEKPLYLHPSIWFNSNLGRLFKQQWIIDDGRYYTYVRLSGAKNLHALELLSESLDNVHFIDKAQNISNQMSRFKVHLAFILIAAFVAALLVFAWRYGIKTASLGLLTPLFSLVFALTLSFAIQQQLNIFNFIAGILILALGLDYSVFYAEHGFTKKITLTTLMSALSSTFVFAILLFSSMPAIRSFGITVFLGISLTFLFSPFITLAKK